MRYASLSSRWNTSRLAYRNWTPITTFQEIKFLLPCVDGAMICFDRGKREKSNWKEPSCTVKQDKRISVKTNSNKRNDVGIQFRIFVFLIFKFERPEHGIRDDWLKRVKKRNKGMHSPCVDIVASQSGFGVADLLENSRSLCEQTNQIWIARAGVV